jgi:hypothetical protein
MRFYRALLLLYPASFRAEYGEEMCAVFARRRTSAALCLLMTGASSFAPSLRALRVDPIKAIRAE